MSTLENTIEKVISEGVSDEKKEIQHEVPASGDAAPAAKMKTDPDAEKHASDAAKKAGDATKPAPKTNAASKQDPIEEPSDGVTKVDKTSIPNQEEVEDDSETPSLEEMSKADLLKHAVASMKEMDAKTLKATYAGLSENDEDDGDGEETSESLSRNALIRKVVESLKDKSVKEVQSFIESLDPAVGDPAKDATEGDRDEDKGNSKATQKQTTPVESKQEEEDEEEEEVKKESYEVDMTDDIEALVADEDLSQEFKTKAKTIFEAAVATKVKERITEVEAQSQKDTDAAVEEIKEDLTEKVDNYLNYVAENWVTENELAIERGLKSELTEDFINGLKKLFEEHYVEVPEDKFDVVEELAGRLDDTEDKLNEEVAQNISLSQDIEELKREKIISEASQELADSEQERLKELTEDVDYEDAEKFQEKVSTLKEAYFKTGKFEAVSDDTTVASSDTDPLSTDEVQNANPGMAGYTAAISKFAKLDD
jgi:catabolite regulation protein CreA